MVTDEFNYKLKDSQGTAVMPLSAAKFQFSKFREYENELAERCKDFVNADSGVMIYRRFRVPEVFASSCASFETSLELQLGALTMSMEYAADIPNFLEPWYGIGVVSSAFGVPYIWKADLAPVVEPPFKSSSEALDSLKSSIAESIEGKRNLEMLHYFLDKSKGQLPISCGDVQSPLNIASSYLLDTTAFMLEMYDKPDDLSAFLTTIAELEIEFYNHQIEILGQSLVRPGHGFASSRHFHGLGFSDDNFTLIGNEHYRQFAMPSLAFAGEALGGTVFHSCGNWADRAGVVLDIPDLMMADGAVGVMTDPSPNDGSTMGEAFAGTGKILHVRIVGNADTVINEVKSIWQPGLKLIVTTYCETPDEQQRAYDGIKRVCS